MDKLKELLEDQNNKMIAIAILVVIILGVVVLFLFMMKGKNSTNTTQSTVPGTMTPGMPSGPIQPGMTPPGPTGSPMPAGVPTTPGMPSPSGMPSAGQPGMDAPAETTEVAQVSSGQPMESGRIDPFAPIGVAKASKTKTFGNAIKADLLAQGVTFRLPSDLEAISFTDFNADTKIGYIKTAADYKREKDKQKAKEAEEKKKAQDAYNAYMYQKPNNIRYSGLSKGRHGNIAQFEVYLGNRSNYETCEVGDTFIYGYNGMQEMKAKVKSISDNSVVLSPVDASDIDWKYNLTDGSSRNQGYGNQGYGMNPMGGANPMGGLNPMGGINPMGGVNPMGVLNPMGGMNNPIM